MDASNEKTNPGRPTSLPAGCVIGFAAAVAVWCGWFLLHTPAGRTPVQTSGPILMLVHALVIFFSARRWVPAGSRPLSGLFAGLVAGLINLLLLGSILARTPSGGDATMPAPGAEALGSSAVLIGLGFLAASTLLGLIGGAVSRAWPGDRTIELASSRTWLGRMSVVAVAAVIPLLLLGGLVTSTGAGFSVTGWPGTFGANMFLYPLALMDDPRIYLEHTHRLFGSLVGLTTLTLFVFTILVDRRGWVRALAGTAFVMVCVQGVLGGEWVVVRTQVSVIIHAVLSQVFFGTMVAWAVAVCAGPRRPEQSADESVRGPGFGVFIVLLGSLVMQLALGAVYRHTRSSHALFTHLGFSLVVMAMAIAAGIVLMRRSRLPGFSPLTSRLQRAGVGLHTLASLQFALGWAAWGAIASSRQPTRVLPTAEQLSSTPTVPILEATIRTLHQANGALLLGLAVAVSLWMIQLWRSPPKGIVSSVEPDGSLPSH